MSKIKIAVQNYSILTFPAIKLLAFTSFELNFGIFYATMLCLIANVATLAPMLKLALNKKWHFRLILGIIATVLFYSFFIIIHLFFPSMFSSDANAKIGYATLTLTIDLLETSVMIIAVCLVGCWPANISIILAFLLNPIYSRKINV